MWLEFQRFLDVGLANLRTTRKNIHNWKRRCTIQIVLSPRRKIERSKKNSNPFFTTIALMLLPDSHENTPCPKSCVSVLKMWHWLLSRCVLLWDLANVKAHQKCSHHKTLYVYRTRSCSIAKTPPVSFFHKIWFREHKRNASKALQ